MTRRLFEIKNEMREKFGEDFINKMNHQKEEYERLQKELEEAENFEEKAKELERELSKNFPIIDDDFNIYPQQMCFGALRRFADRCVKNDWSKDEIKEAQKVYEKELFDNIQENINVLQEELDKYKHI